MSSIAIHMHVWTPHRSYSPPTITKAESQECFLPPPALGKENHWASKDGAVASTTAEACDAHARADFHSRRHTPECKQVLGL